MVSHHVGLRTSSPSSVAHHPAMMASGAAIGTRRGIPPLRTPPTVQHAMLCQHGGDVLWRHHTAVRDALACWLHNIGRPVCRKLDVIIATIFIVVAAVIVVVVIAEIVVVGIIVIVGIVMDEVAMVAVVVVVATVVIVVVAIVVIAVVVNIALSPSSPCGHMTLQSIRCPSAPGMGKHAPAWMCGIWVARRLL